MNDEIGAGELEAAAEAPGEADTAAGAEEAADAAPELAAPIESRFVDVAAQREKQLRRGALPRIEELAAGADADSPDAPRRKFERIAMREVDRGKIRYEVPDPKPPTRE